MNLKSTLLLVPIVFCCFAKVVAQAPQTFPLYGTGAIPNSKPAENRETEVNDWKVEFTTETSVPTLTIFRPAKPNGASRSPSPSVSPFRLEAQISLMSTCAGSSNMHKHSANGRRSLVIVKSDFGVRGKSSKICDLEIKCV